MADKTLAIRLQIEGSKQLQDLGRAINNDEVALRKLNKRIRQGKGATDLDIKAKNSLTASLKANRNAYRDNEAAVLRQNKALRKNSGFVAGVRKGVGQWATSMIGITVAIGAVTKLVGGAVKIFKDFEKSNSKLAAVLGESKDAAGNYSVEMQGLIKQAKELGGTTAFTATQVTELQTEFAKLGFPTEDIVLMTKATLNGAAALGSDLGEQAALTGALLKQFGLDASEAGRLNDVLAESAKSSALDFSKLSTALPIVGATANAVGEDLESTTALLGTLSDRGLDASTSGTALRNVFLELSKQGLTMEQAMEMINTSTDRAKTSMELFGKRGATAGLILAETGESVDALEDKLRKADGAAQDMADTMLNNLSGDITIAQSAWEGFILSLEDGSGVLSTALRDVTQGFTGILNDLTLLNDEAAPTQAKWTTIGNFFIDYANSFIKMGSGIFNIVDTIAGTNLVESLQFDKIEVAEKKLTELEKENIALAEKRRRLDKVAAKEKSDTQAQVAKDLAEAAEEDEKRNKGKAQKEINREKKKNEKIAADKIAATKKLQEQLDQLNIDSITNDREREEAQLRDSFTRKIEAITGNSELEKELRFRLEEEMHEALNEQQAVFREEDRAKEEEELTLKKELDLEIKTQESEEDLLKKREDLKIAREDIIADQTLTNQQKLKLLKELDQQIRDNEVKLAKFKKDTAEDVAAQAANLAGALGSLAKEGSNEAKAAAVVQAGINGALAITQALAQLGPIAGALAAVGIGITTGVQIAKISGAQFADGGVLQGASHSNGGIPFSIGGQSGFEAEGGEAIINKRSTSMFGDLLSDINEAGGGVAFARGGLARKYANGGALPNSQGVTASQQRESIQMGMGEFANQIVEGINDKEVINVSTNTTEVSNEVVNTAAEATF